jgi:hypothetical protein
MQRRKWIICATVLAVLAGCKGSKPGPQGTPSASAPSAAVSAAPASAVIPASVSPSASAAAPSSPAADGLPQGSGVSEFLPAEKTDACKPRSAEIGSYLQRGELALGGRDDSIAASWLVVMSSRSGAQVAFSSFDREANKLARARGVSAALERTPRLFPAGAGWTLSWFDSAGLAFTRPQLVSTPPPPIEHLGAVGADAADDVAVSVTPTGSLVAVAPVGGDRKRLGVFLFAPVEADAPPLTALGVMRHAKQPTKPAVAAGAGGYHVAWMEEGGQIVASHFDSAGKETEQAHSVASASGTSRDRLTLGATATGAIALWMEGETILARALDAQAKPSSPTWVIGKGRWASLAATDEGALVSWVGADQELDKLVLVRLGKDAAPAAKGLRVGESAVKDPPALAVAGDRAALGWMEVMGPTVSTKRAVLRTLDMSCVP